MSKNRNSYFAVCSDCIIWVGSILSLLAVVEIAPRTSWLSSLITWINNPSPSPQGSLFSLRALPLSLLIWSGTEATHSNAVFLPVCMPKDSVCKICTQVSCYIKDELAVPWLYAYKSNHHYITCSALSDSVFVVMHWTGCRRICLDVHSLFATVVLPLVLLLCHVASHKGPS